MFMVPPTLQGQIKESTEDDILSTASAMLKFLRRLPEFKHSIKNFADPERFFYKKNKKYALDLKKSGNDCFSRGVYCKALSLYSQALRVAPSSAEDGGKNLVAMLYLNRALVLLNMGLLVECVRDCNRALAISPSYSKAWYRRGKANASLENYGDAVRDLHVALNMEQSLNEKKKIENELKSVSYQHKDTLSSQDRPNENKSSSGTDEPHQIKIECVSTPTKGKGMASVSEIPKASLIHTEEPYAAIILKEHRETHCHFCFNRLPADMIPCSCCGSPLYCSEQCLKQDGGQTIGNNSKSCAIHETLSDELNKHIADITSANVSASDNHPFFEHRHECHGVHWPAVFPPDVVLAGRMLVKASEQTEHRSYLSKTPVLTHHYAELSLEKKLEFHIYSVALIYCLQNSHRSEFPINGETVAKVITLLSMITTNSMAIVRMESPDVYGPDSITTSVEQVRVAQAIYSAGSMFNHSCLPNIHAYFLSRTLYVRSTEFIAAGCPLELSYGPQVGEWHWYSRLEHLKDKYAFLCRCRGCTEINLPDLVLSAFRCVKPDCFGVILGNATAQYIKFVIDYVRDVPPMSSSEPHMQVEKLKDEEIDKVAGHVFELARCSDQIKPASCLRCGSSRDLDASYATIEEPGPDIEKLEREIFHDKIQTDTLSDALRALDVLRSTLHPYNKKIAQVEDNIAHAFSLVGELELALDHCKASIEILEKHYGPDHVAIANELVKLASIQLSLGDQSAVEISNRVDAIFLQYYGSHANTIFPFLQDLKTQARELVQ